MKNDDGKKIGINHNNPLKCLIIGPAFPLRGGIANFNEALGATLIKMGIKCTIISFTLQYPAFLFPGKTQNEAGEGVAGLPIVTMINSINPWSWFKTAAFIKKEKPEFVIFRYWLPFMAPCLGTIARLVKKKTKVIAITDNIIPHEKRPGDKFLTSYFVNSCHAFIAMSKSVLDDLSLFTTNKNKFFSPHPVYNIFGEPIEKSIARRHLGLDEEGRYLLFFGFIRKYKGLDLLLNAMVNQMVMKKKIKLIVAGEFYEDEAECLELIRKNGIAENVILRTSFIPRDEVKYYFSAADLVVQPYRNATQSGITQIAYHFDKPMLVTHVGGLPEIVKDGHVGYVTEVNSESIAKAILDFYTNNKEDQYILNVKVEKLNFSWETFANKVIEVSNSIS